MKHVPHIPTRLVVVLSTASASVLLVAACQPASSRLQTPPSPALAVAAAPVGRGALQTSVAYTGEMRAPDQITVLPKASGRVRRVLVDVVSLSTPTRCWSNSSRTRRPSSSSRRRPTSRRPRPS